MSNNLESNKIFASILLSSLIFMLSGFFADILYKSDTSPEQRGFQILIENQDLSDKSEENTETDIKALVEKGIASEGKALFKKCISCHSIEENGNNKVGPNLYDVFSSSKASKETYNYSKAFQTLEGIWDEESLFYFLKKPSKFVPGTKMSFIGFRKDSELANIIAYLKLNSTTKSSE